jgi:hypothetical protein
MSEPLNYIFTIATVAAAEKTAVKTLTRHADGSVTKTSDYDYVTWWTFAPTSASSHEEMATCLRGLALDRHKMLVMGDPVAGLDLRKPHRRQWADPARATLCAVAREWIALDMDDVPVPPELGRPERLIDAARYVRDKLLPHEFIDTSMVVSPTAQSGLRGDALARMRLWFALDRAVPLADLKRWATGVRKVHDLPVDGSVLQAGQPIYTGRPSFVGMNDPISPGMHAVVVSGFCADTVALNASAFDVRAAAIDHAITHATHQAHGDWRRLLDATLGVNGFFEPLSKALGLAAGSADSIADILAFVAALLTERADPGRRLQYGPTWVRRTVERFRQKDGQARAEIASLHSRVFGGHGNG